MTDSQVPNNPPLAPQSDTSSKVPLLGSLCLAASVVIVLLILFDGSGARLPFMPRSWYTNRPLWLLIAVGGFVTAFFLLRHRADGGKQQSTGRTGPAFERMVLYTRAGCHLCDDARQTLVVHRVDLPDIEEIDIDSDPQLVERFGECVPVVEIDGTVRFRGRVNEVLLRRLIDGARTGESRGTIQH